MSYQKSDARSASRDRKSERHINKQAISDGCEMQMFKL